MWKNVKKNSRKQARKSNYLGPLNDKLKLLKYSKCRLLFITLCGCMNVCICVWEYACVCLGVHLCVWVCMCVKLSLPFHFWAGKTFRLQRYKKTVWKSSTKSSFNAFHQPSFATQTYHNIREGRGWWHTRGDQLHILQPGQQTLQQQSSHILTCALKTMRNFWRERKIYIYIIYSTYI